MQTRPDAVAGTGLLVAAIRARESTRDDPLFTDPFADKLAGEAGHRILDAALATSGERTTMQIVVRTRFWDDGLLDAAASCRQIVLLAAGMDARAYRLTWPPGTTVFELDQPSVIAAKNALLADDSPTCSRVAIGGGPRGRLARFSGGRRLRLGDPPDGMADRRTAAVP